MLEIRFPFNSCQLKTAIFFPLNYLIEIGLWYLGYYLVMLWIETEYVTLGWLFWVACGLFFRAVMGVSMYGGGHNEERKSMMVYNAHYYFPVITLWRALLTVVYLITKIPIRLRYKYND